jgi:hypothetical protein
MKTVQDGDTRNIPEEAKVSLYSDFNLGQCFLNIYFVIVVECWHLWLLNL